MAKKSNKKTVVESAAKVGGINVFTDPKGRAVYFNRFNKIGYILTDSEKAYRPYSLRFFLGIFAGVLAYMFEIQLWLCTVIGIIVYAVMEVRFRLFLKKLPHISNFKPEKRQGHLDAEKSEDMGKLVMKTILYLAFSGLIVANATIEGYRDIILYFNYALVAFGIIMACVELRAIIIKKQK